MRRAHLTSAGLAALLGLGSLPAAAAGLTAYQADIEDARWHSVAGAAACHLFHTIPLLGTAVISEDADGRHSTTLVLQRASRSGQSAGVYRTAPVWKPARRARLGRLNLAAGATTIGLGHGDSVAVVAALEAGDRVDIDFRAAGDVGGAVVAAVLSPVRFRAALGEHRQCLARVLGGGGDTPTRRAPAAPPAGTGAPAVAARPAPGPAGMRPVAAPVGPAAPPPEGIPHAAANNGAEVSGLPAAPGMEIHFAHDDAGFDRVDFDRVRDLARILMAEPFWSTVTVTGHADASGDARRNRSLALARAIEVRNRLIQEGVPARRIEVVAHGESRPVASNASEYGRARNRRVEVRARL